MVQVRQISVQDVAQAVYKRSHLVPQPRQSFRRALTQVAAAAAAAAAAAVAVAVAAVARRGAPRRGAVRRGGPRPLMVMLVLVLVVLDGLRRRQGVAGPTHRRAREEARERGVGRATGAVRVEAREEPPLVVQGKAVAAVVAAVGHAVHQPYLKEKKRHTKSEAARTARHGFNPRPPPPPPKKKERVVMITKNAWQLQQSRFVCTRDCA
jgi:hypothetical protein